MLANLFDLKFPDSNALLVQTISAMVTDHLPRCCQKSVMASKVRYKTSWAAQSFSYREAVDQIHAVS